MKEYNTKIIVDNDNLKIAFECDKERNNECKKTNCDICNYTTNSKYIKARARQRNKDITDSELICNLENEIEYYRHEIELLTNIHRENVECINKQDELIKEYQKTFKAIIINNEDILRTRTPNQIRKMLGYDEIDNKNRNNSKVLDEQFEITINNEDYIIEYNGNREINLIELNVYITKLINEKDKIIICKDNQFRIINTTRERTRNMELDF